MNNFIKCCDRTLFVNNARFNDFDILKMGHLIKRVSLVFIDIDGIVFLKCKECGKIHKLNEFVLKKKETVFMDI